MLQYDEFREKLLDMFNKEISLQLPGYHVATQNTCRMNITTESICVRPDANNGKSSIIPMIYTENIYDGYLGSDMEAEPYIDNTIRNYMEYFEKGMEIMAKRSIEIENIIDKDSLFPQVINAEKNKEYLKDKPHRLMLDLAIIYKYEAPDFNGNVAVNNSMAEKLHMPEEQLYETAIKNLENKYRPQICNLLDLVGLPEMEGTDDLLYVVANRENMYGANALLLPSVFEEFKEKAGGSFYIIPSSIHELILVKGEEYEPGKLTDMIMEVNSIACAGRSFLSDNLYRYNSESKQIEFAMPDKVKSKEKKENIIGEKKTEKDAKAI